MNHNFCYSTNLMNKKCSLIMLLLTGAEGDSLSSPVSKRFGHSNYFTLFNTETKTFSAFTLLVTDVKNK